MADKKTKVILISNSLKEDGREFDMEHAQELLNYQESHNNISDWQLKPDSGFEYKDGIINSTSTGTAEKPGKRGGNSGGDQP